MIAPTLASMPSSRPSLWDFKPGFLKPGFLKFGHFRCVRRTALAIVVLAAGLGAIDVGAPKAQEGDLKAVLDRIDRLQKEMTTLQRHIYRGEEPPAELAPAPGASLSDTQAARFEVRLTQFESELRSLTGQIEEQNFRLNQFAKRLDKLVADVDDRLQRVEQAIESGTVPGAGDTAAGGQGQSDPAAGSTQNIIGQISAEQAAASQKAGQQTAKLEAGATPEEQYEFAFGLLSRNDFDGAEQVLSTFLEQHPSDKLAGNAKYWLGETYYVRGRYAEAAITFAEGYETYPESVKAPDNLLKLGKSLAALGQKEDACGTFAELHKRYGSASSTILQQAKNEQKKLSCQ